MTKVDKLQQNIMRRVYYIYGLRLVTHPISMYGLVLLALLVWLKELVFFARIWESFVRTPIGEVDAFMLKLISHADGLTLGISFAVVAFGFIWLRQVLSNIRFPALAV